SEASETRASEMEVDDLIQVAPEAKLAALGKALAQRGCGLDACAYVGDDLADVPVLRAVGLAIAVANAASEVKAAARIVTSVPGGLGVVGREHAALLLSKSGASDELFVLLEHLKRLGVPVIALTGDPDGLLARHADVVLDASVTEEACPETLAPTASTTAALALGDALAVALLEVKGFRREQFAALHPAGTLGRKLLLRVGDVMLTGDLPTLRPERPMRECVVLLAEKRGTVAVVDATGALVGVVTAGDLTRLMERTDRFLDIPVGDVMTRSPKSTRADELAGAAVRLMEQHGIMALPVLDGGAQVVGMVHLHDLMRAGAA